MCANGALLGVDVRDRAARDVGDGERRGWGDRRIGPDRGDSPLRSRHSGGSLLDGVRPASARTVEQLDGFRVLLRPPRAAAARAVTCWASSGTADRGVADAAGARKPSSSSGFRARCAPSTYRRTGGRAGRPSALTRCSAEAGHRGEALGPAGRPRRSVESWCRDRARVHRGIGSRARGVAVREPRPRTGRRAGAAARASVTEILSTGLYAGSVGSVCANSSIRQLSSLRAVFLSAKEGLSRIESLSRRPLRLLGRPFPAAPPDPPAALPPSRSASAAAGLCRTAVGRGSSVRCRARHFPAARRSAEDVRIP